ncbi:MAG: hypothetical protein P8J33_16625 [Pirellulaceae bacterium]|nr:hypothetical protein [Pirellulaceae bacterium]
MNDKKRNAIVLLMDGLNPSYLSAHGCTWINTPAFDQLAADSVVFERGLTESVDSQKALAAFLGECHAGLVHAEDASLSPGLSALAEGGVPRLLLTDDVSALAGLESHFDQVIELGQAGEAAGLESAEDIGDTFLAQCFAGVINELPKQSAPFLAVIHLTNLTRVWDAPLEMRDKYRDEEDPEALKMVTAVQQTGDFDPDEILGVTHAYGAQLETLDTCLDVFLQEMQLDGLWENTRMVLAGMRGFPLGHRGQIGHALSHLASDALRVPLWVRPADAEAEWMSPARTHELTSISEWLSIATGWISGEKNERMESVLQGRTDDPQMACHGVVICENAAAAIWTPAWLLVEKEGEIELFVKPEDRWDVNPVQDRCRGVAEDLEKTLADACRKLRAHEAPDLNSLADELVFGLE